MANNARCRFCGTPLGYTFVDLGLSPLSESYRRQDQLNEPDTFYPLHVYVCESCFLVQLEEFVAPEHIFTEYAYFSSYATSWVAHAAAYVAMAVKRFKLDGRSHVVEIGSNDGYLLQHFGPRGIHCLGIEPAANVAMAAREKGIATRVLFFGASSARELAAEGKGADLLIGNNVLAHVPGLNDFVQGLKILLKPGGAITLEFPHLMRLIEGVQFDTIYHEHFSYFSLLTVRKIFASHGLRLFDVEELSTHGGSLRIYGCHAEDTTFRTTSSRMAAIISQEKNAGLDSVECYSRFGESVKEAKRAILSFLISAKRAGKSIVAYGAPGKGNTLLNYCGIGTDFIDYTVDRNPYKQGKFLPGTHIPIHAPERLRETRPDYVVVLPWNLKDEIMKQCAFIRDWGGQYVIPIPTARVC
jgi:SAM-dependent methyltransferase